MTPDRFPACLAFTLAREGGWSDDPQDSGGATMKGVTIATFRAWRHDPVATVAQLRAIGDAELRAIYGGGYWQPCHCQALPAGVDLMTFDMAVNSGVRRSAMLLQSAAGVTADGWIGPATLAAVASAPNLIDNLGRRQDAFYRSLDGFPRFGKGWLSRLAQRVTTARAMAATAGL